MADKPSRGLVLYGDGLARFVNPSHTHLHALAAQSLCGLLSLPHLPPTENVDGRTIGEFLNLLDAYDDFANLGVGSQDKCVTPSISERDYCPMLFAQWQDAVTRKDTVKTFSFQDFMENGGNLTIPADRFVHEVAFKLWKAPSMEPEVLIVRPV